ncbi:hypothetical protein OG239_42650 (plasmid) [Streptomyces sp. NBC_00868]|uniref:hypothetical protein n=1 Tax=Streptomyces sp. NBC_00868 TaxID=2903683 RepID=UPI002F918DCC|nr:hypothetical protein OG239_42650 [Streptomyces sp. NBC_00868]
MTAESGGPRPVTWFPDDLVALQQRWTRIFNRLASDPPADGHEMRMELLRLSFRLDAHPHWATTEAGWSRAARHELQEYATAAPGGEEQLVTLCVDGRIIAVPPGEAASRRRGR